MHVNYVDYVKVQVTLCPPRDACIHYPDPNYAATDTVVPDGWTKQLKQKFARLETQLRTK